MPFKGLSVGKPKGLKTIRVTYVGKPSVVPRSETAKRKISTASAGVVAKVLICPSVKGVAASASVDVLSEQ